MYRLLIVDDEPYIVEGLRELFDSADDLQLEIFTATSSKEALDILGEIRIDITVSDIRMFGMDGLELVQEIKKHWPSCRVIMLTGFSDFCYVQSAISTGADAYILKSQDDSVLLDAVRKSIQSIEEAQCEESIRSLIKKALDDSVPLLQQEYIKDLLHGLPSSVETRSKKFAELNILLHPGRSVYMVGARIDRDSEVGYETISQVHAIFSSALASHAECLFISWDRKYTLWILQNKNASVFPDIDIFTTEMLDEIQQQCSDVLHVSLSFIAGDNLVSWEELPENYQRIRRLLAYGISVREKNVIGRERFFTYNVDLLQPVLPDMKALENALLLRQRDQFDDLLRSLIAYLRSATQASALQAYHQFSAVILSYIQTTNRIDEYIQDFGDLRLLESPCLDAENRFNDELFMLASWLFSTSSENTVSRESHIVDTIHQYISAHLSENLTLAVLAKKVYLSPVYLSRVYKNYTGKNLSQYIQEERIKLAKTLLRSTNERINEIAFSSGFESAAHFSRTFKKAVGISPQDYRSKVTGN